ncbi:hypothetical protein [Pontixanthobacter sp. CEM42]|uniref:hypothetical protein n=1 Tax=Pontixanthobacter sp. CEM42 TaxID=2792077 RepID=UPI001ADF5CC0|nr:hypothetical protein [Pontixanthobacter sp. CEM42]
MKPNHCLLALCTLVTGCSPESQREDSDAFSNRANHSPAPAETREIGLVDRTKEIAALTPDDWAPISSRGAHARFAVVITDGASGKTTGALGYISLDGSLEHHAQQLGYAPAAEKTAKKKYQKEAESFPAVTGYSMYASGKKFGYDTLLNMPLLRARYVNRELGIFCSMNRPGEAHCIWGNDSVRYKLSFDSLKTESVLPYLLRKAKEGI